MYSGLYIFSKHSGAIVGAHQKIDRVARLGLTPFLSKNSTFPAAKSILHFEGMNGPDGIKLKSPGKDEPWHFVDPFDKKDDRLSIILNNHYKELVNALKAKDMVRSSFEAAWLAHALVDGLTPAHHYPFEDEMSKLRGGEGQDTRVSVKTKLIMPGETLKAKVSNNWLMWGPKGLYTTHIMFETGFATMIAPMRFKNVTINPRDVGEFKELGLSNWFKKQLGVVAGMELYESFARKGWTIKLGRVARLQLAPQLVKDVILVWYCASFDAGLIKTAK
ncbi:MAG TPA: hypothetical protein VMR18_00730 [Candidatus Saccharimonadales bacterium]|jgi:hypothetical protein|nr:hypothetical protein [Candidatus Saccharimonadales bacterium]